MDLTSAQNALRALTQRSKISQGAKDTAKELYHVLYPDNDSEKHMQLNDQYFVSQVEHLMTACLYYGKERWEPLAVVYLIVQELLTNPSSRANTTQQCWFSRAFVQETIPRMVHQDLEHSEPRVRMCVAKLLGAFASNDLSWTMRTFASAILESIICHMHRSPDFEENDPSYLREDDNISVNGMETPPASPSAAETPHTPSTPYRLDDVSGWKALESSLCALKYIIQGGNQAFLSKTKSVRDGVTQEMESFEYLTPQVWDIISLQSCFHINRHVRVVGLDTMTSVCEIAPPKFLDQHPQLSQTICTCLVRGMQDNWSQVRFAASIATRTFLLKLQDPHQYYPQLVPRLCLNRYYIAERVQQYSQESWQLLMGNNGRQVVAKYTAEIVDYYVEMSNHCVREAACHCIAELATKVDREAIRPHVPRLLDALLICFRDNSWLIRDAACLATSQFVLAFPSECQELLDELYTLWFDHLSDKIWSVREDAAIALGNVIRGYGNDALNRIVERLEQYLEMAKQQPAISQQEYAQLLQTEKQHMSKQAFSCCSLEPKSEERTETREKQPWEYTDGAIYLVRELCDVAPEIAVKYLPNVADVAILRHFPQTAVLQQTIWKQLPFMAKALGKRVFKRYLELFFDPLVFTLQGSNRLAQFAARDCIAQLSSLIGITIFSGRLSINPIWRDTLSPYAADTQYP